MKLDSSPHCLPAIDYRSFSVKSMVDSVEFNFQHRLNKKRVHKSGDGGAQCLPSILTAGSGDRGALREQPCNCKVP